MQAVYKCTFLLGSLLVESNKPFYKLLLKV